MGETVLSFSDPYTDLDTDPPIENIVDINMLIDILPINLLVKIAERSLSIVVLITKLLVNLPKPLAADEVLSSLILFKKNLKKC
ncbi:hypothetical protein [Serratia proteamaculans]